MSDLDQSSFEEVVEANALLEREEGNGGLRVYMILSKEFFYKGEKQSHSWRGKWSHEEVLWFKDGRNSMSYAVRKDPVERNFLASSSIRRY